MCDAVARPQQAVLFPMQEKTAFLDVTIKEAVFRSPKKLLQLKAAIAAVPSFDKPPYIDDTKVDSVLNFAGTLSQTLGSNDFAVVFGVSTHRFEDFFGVASPESAVVYKKRVSANNAHTFPAIGGDLCFHVKSGLEAEKKGSIDAFIAHCHRVLDRFMNSPDDLNPRINGVQSPDGRNQFGYFDAGSNPKVTANPVLVNGPKVNAYPYDETLDLAEVPADVRAAYTPAELFASLNTKTSEAEHSRCTRSSRPDVGSYATTFINKGDHVGGSFLIWQEWIHTGLAEFESMDEDKQNAVFGRLKGSGALIKTVADPLDGGINKEFPRAHIVRAHVRMTNTDAETANVCPLVQNPPGASTVPLQINRQAQGFIETKGENAGLKGLNFIAYGKDCQRFDQILDRMIGSNVTWPVPRNDTSTDHLLQFSKATSGRYFYIPNAAEICRMVRDDPKSHYDIAIVGGGVSGLFSAWRLKQQTPELNIAVFERANFLGGRLVSIKAPGTQIACEFGGMRVPTNAKDFKSFSEPSSLFPYTNVVVNDLELEKIQFPVDADINPVVARGTLTTIGEISGAAAVKNNFQLAKELYNLSPTAIKALANADCDHSLYIYLLKEHLGYQAKIEATNPASMNHIRQYLRTLHIDVNGNVTKDTSEEKLSNMSVHMLWLRVYGAEAFAFQRLITGYYVPFGNWNAIDALVDNLADFVAGVKYVRLKYGYNTLVKKMSNEFAKLGGEVYTERTLDSFAYGTDGFTLDFEGTRVQADKLILAMPAECLKRIESPLLLQPSVRQMVNSTVARPFLKVFLVYETAWWDTGSKDPLAGRSLNDLPMRQTYFWETEKDTVEGTTGKSVIMIYDDGKSPEFWNSLVFKTQRRKATKNVQTDDDAWEGNPGITWNQNKAPNIMKVEAHRQFVSMFSDARVVNKGKQEKNYPLNCGYASWTEDTVFGGGVNFWLPGTNSQKVIKNMTQPIPKIPLHICGSCFSNTQGWVEGALSTADDMLIKHFDGTSILSDVSSSTKDDDEAFAMQCMSDMQDKINALEQELAKHKGDKQKPKQDQQLPPQTKLSRSISKTEI